MPTSSTGWSLDWRLLINHILHEYPDAQMFPLKFGSVRAEQAPLSDELKGIPLHQLISSRSMIYGAMQVRLPDRSTSGYIVQFQELTGHLMVKCSTGATPADIMASFQCLYAARKLWCPAQYIRLGVAMPIWSVSNDWCHRVSYGMLDIYLRAIEYGVDMTASIPPLFWLNGVNHLLSKRCTVDDAKAGSIAVMQQLIRMTWPQSTSNIVWDNINMSCITIFAAFPIITSQQIPSTITPTTTLASLVASSSSPYASSTTTTSSSDGVDAKVSLLSPNKLKLLRSITFSVPSSSSASDVHNNVAGSGGSGIVMDETKASISSSILASVPASSTNTTHQTNTSPVLGSATSVSTTSIATHVNVVPS
jgi:hypothetical protein